TRASTPHLRRRRAATLLAATDAHLDGGTIMTAGAPETATHFSKARWPMRVPLDQLRIAAPRIGVAGARDGRFDLRLLEGIAHARPDWNVVLVGPVPDVQRAWLDHTRNIHR